MVQLLESQNGPVHKGTHDRKSYPGNQRQNKTPTVPWTISLLKTQPEMPRHLSVYLASEISLQGEVRQCLRHAIPQLNSYLQKRSETSRLTVYTSLPVAISGEKEGVFLFLQASWRSLQSRRVKQALGAIAYFRTEPTHGRFPTQCWEQ